MPEAMKKSLFARLIASVGRQECIINVGDEDKPFECIHFSWYNRYTPKNVDVPQDTHPHMLQRTDGTSINITQMMPYQCRDVEKYRVLYDNIKFGFEDAFAWICEVFESHLPDEYSRLTEAIDMLPGASHSPFSPMSSLVVNLNISTLAHRDSFDKELCLVMPVGEFDGGALVLVEQGLVLPLRNEDITVFWSAETTHFNMTYSGRCCSFVMQTDKEFNKWVNNHNGWSGNTLFN
ncbi:hypothetical protein SCLCIDRAFT_138648 [Scleroderma citrinum Foug A]|uniref:Prolyl 4-hydroxylase alpha subunit Fe(2+) 2OG dioxygenase domain-containing protein n=1 Tax=Scleroderma citrinum Foug A TaxID=1036808 RepID=A0A0C3CYK4_9AGAM|nr:hypothetical protein SCLCIDRAFT_138648 [Scleroderma citrinum Foug A]